ncbi:MAG: hypothetical protein K9N35_07455 [Candidatus Marinimicrobia bacterium]|nr:hypothetical protein [Candidatus Neomarinimicrobiota bacterium]
MVKTEKMREGYCPVYDIKCPEGLDAAESCNDRMGTDYNPITNFRDADIEHCAIYRQEQLSQQNQSKDSGTALTSAEKE